MLQVMCIGWFKRFIARGASESLINEMRLYDRQRLQKLAEYADNPPLDYPWRDPEKSRVFWQTYRRMVGLPRNADYARK